MDFLLMGGQACIVYGAAEFSRDVDVNIRVAADNLDRLRSALVALDASPVFFPELSPAVLARGHACHFRCGVEDAAGLRLDVMARQRGLDDWSLLWARRNDIRIPGVGCVSVMGLADLVRAKKTQRDKDWPIIRRLVERDIAVTPRPGEEQLGFWLLECRSPELLIGLAVAHAPLASELIVLRPLLEAVLARDEPAVRSGLRQEEDLERERDRAYWAPLRAELEQLRRAARRRSS